MNASRRYVAALIASFIALSAAVAPSFTAVSAKTTSVQTKAPVYKVLWREEFNSKTRQWPNEKYWSYDLGNNGGWGNNENEYYTMSNAKTDCGAVTKVVKGKKKAVCSGKGSLVITANRIDQDSIEAASCTNCSFFSSRINTQGKLGFKYGRMEARIQMPKGDGTWPAFWLLGANITSVPWPTCGEIDIVEVGNDQYTSNSTIHGPVSGFMGITNGGKQADKPLYSGYHTYRVDWYPTKFIFSLDGKPYYTITKAEATGSSYNDKWVYDHEFFLILNLAMGGNYVGGTPDPAIKSTQMKIDYIRYSSINGMGKLYRH